MIKKFLAIYILLASINVTGQTLKTHNDPYHHLSLSYPSDWIVKKGISATTIFKAVKKFPSGNYLMLTVTAQPLDASGDSTDNYSIDDLTGLVKKMYGEENVKLLKASRGSVGELSTIRLWMDIHSPIIQPRISESFFVIKGSYLYSIAASCNKSLYPDYASSLTKLCDLFTFNDSFTTSSHQDSLSITTASNKGFLSAYLGAFGEVWVRNVVIAAIVFVGSIIGIQLKRKSDKTD